MTAIALIAGCMLAGEAAWAQISTVDRVFDTVYTAADGTKIHAVGVNSARPESASGTNKSKHAYSVVFTYEPAGISYLFSAGGENTLTVSVLQGSAAIWISAKDSSRTTQWLIFQQLVANTENRNNALLIYMHDSILRNPTISKSILTGVATYSSVGKSLNGLFPQYKSVVDYFSPVLAAIAAGAPQVNSDNSGFTIETRLNAGLPQPLSTVCPEAGPKLTPLSTLACIGAGIEIGIQSTEPDALLSQSEAQSISALPAKAGRNPRKPLPIEKTI